jgi:hypothetical protein
MPAQKNLRPANDNACANNAVYKIDRLRPIIDLLALQVAREEHKRLPSNDNNPNAIGGNSPAVQQR